MISKKLLSAILGDIQEFTLEEHKIRYCKLGDFDDWKEINIYELAHKCKEWANNLSPKRFQLCSYIAPWSLGYSSYAIYSGAIKQDKEIHACTDPEAVFKACEWILEQSQRNQ